MFDLFAFSPSEHVNHSFNHQLGATTGMWHLALRLIVNDFLTELRFIYTSNFSPLLLKAPLGRTLDRGRGASGSGAARPPKQCVWVSWAGQARALDVAEWWYPSGDEDGDDLRASSGLVCRHLWLIGTPGLVVEKPTSAVWLVCPGECCRKGELNVI